MRKSAVMPSISVVVTTYNWVEALDMVLRALSKQTYAHMDIIVADDGSRQETYECVKRWQKQSKHPIQHVWQEDKGFRAAKIRNRAIAHSSHDFVVFIDGDCVVQPTFVEQYARLATQGSFISGNRILLKQGFTERSLKQQAPIENYSLGQWFNHRWSGQCNRLLPLLKLPLGPLRYRKRAQWAGVKTCNLGVWRADLEKVNGLDESYSGWGYEDSDLVIRLLKTGLVRKEGRFAIPPVFHLWHPEQSREKAKENFAKLADIQNDTRIKAVTGLDQYRLGVDV